MTEITRNEQTILSIRVGQHGKRAIVLASDEARKALELLSGLQVYESSYAQGGAYFFPVDGSLIEFIIEMHPPKTMRTAPERIPAAPESPVNIALPGIEEAA